jgi:hypothetical protein
MLRRIIIVFICINQSVKNGANFPQSEFSAFLSILALLLSIMKEAKNVKRSVVFECVTVDGREKLFSSRPVVSYMYSSSNVMMKLNYDIRIHNGVTEH